MTLDSNLDLLVVVLAVARLTRLATRDFILDKPRRWVQRHAGEQVAYLAGCPWCASIWIAFAVVVTVEAWPFPWVRVVLTALACSHVVGLLALIDPADEYGDEHADADA